MEDRRLVFVQLGRIPWRDVRAHADLSDGRDALLRRARALVELIVEADEVRRRCTGHDRGEHVRLRDDVARLVSAPAVPMQTDVLWIGVPELDHLLYRARHAVQRRRSRCTDLVDDVGLEYEIAVARIRRELRTVAVA